MTDIVERLRQGVDPGDITETEFAMDTGADEIKRLRDRETKLSVRVIATQGFERMSAEVKQLRAALKPFANRADCSLEAALVPVAWLIEARRALKKKS